MKGEVKAFSQRKLDIQNTQRIRILLNKFMYKTQLFNKEKIFNIFKLYFEENNKLQKERQAFQDEVDNKYGRLERLFKMK